MRVALCVVLVALVAVSGDVDACVLESPEITPYELDPAYAKDTVAPGTPQVTFSISRHEVGGGCAQTDCDGKYANVYVDVTGGDDQTPPERLGYILTITGGDTPVNMYTAVPNGMPVFQSQGSFTYGFDDDDHEYAFDLEVRTVDLNGNVSEPTLLHIAEHDAGGCSTTSSGRSAWLSFPVIGFLLRRRGRRSGSGSLPVVRCVLRRRQSAVLLVVSGSRWRWSPSWWARTRCGGATPQKLISSAGGATENP